MKNNISLFEYEQILEYKRGLLIVKRVGRAFRKIGIEPVLSKIESEIDAGDPVLLEIGESVLEDLFSSQEDWIGWCERWSGDERKERVILKSLGIILT